MHSGLLRDFVCCHYNLRCWRIIVQTGFGKVKKVEELKKVNGYKFKISGFLNYVITKCRLQKVNLFFSFFLLKPITLMYPVTSNFNLLHNVGFIFQPFFPAAAHFFFINICFGQFNERCNDQPHFPWSLAVEFFHVIILPVLRLIVWTVRSCGLRWAPWWAIDPAGRLLSIAAFLLKTWWVHSHTHLSLFAQC